MSIEPPRAAAPSWSTEAFGWREWVLLVGTASIWGSSFLFIDVGLDSLRPGVISTLRVALGALAIGLVPRARRAIDRADWPRIALLGVVWTGVPLLLFPLAQQWIDSSVAGMINAAVPITTALWAVALYRRVPGRAQAWGLTIGFAGVLAISWPNAAGSRAGTIGVLLVVAAVACYGLAANLAVDLQQRYGALPVILRAQLVALIIVTPFGVAQLGDSTWAWRPVLAMIPLGVLGTGLAFVLMTVLVGRVGAGRGSIAIYFTPIVAIGLGATVLGEAIHPLTLGGTAMVLTGAWAASRRESPRRRRGTIAPEATA